MEGIGNLKEGEDWKFSVFLQVDSGGHRCGVDYNDSKTVEFALNIMRSEATVLTGIYTHAGHSYKQENTDKLQQVVLTEQESVEQFSEAILDKLSSDERESFINGIIISIGSTPSLSFKGDNTVSSHTMKVNEYHPGNYVFFDQMQAEIGSCNISNCCAYVVSTVVSCHLIDFNELLMLILVE